MIPQRLNACNDTKSTNMYLWFCFMIANMPVINLNSIKGALHQVLFKFLISYLSSPQTETPLERPNPRTETSLIVVGFSPKRPFPSKYLMEFKWKMIFEYFITCGAATVRCMVRVAERWSLHRLWFRSH